MRKWEPVPRHPGLFSYETKKGTRYGVRLGYKDITGAASQIDVMHYLGHKNLQMTADYTRPTEEASLDVFNSFKKSPGGTKSK